jgi:hypothetical protein
MSIIEDCRKLDEIIADYYSYSIVDNLVIISHALANPVFPDVSPIPIVFRVRIVLRGFFR